MADEVQRCAVVGVFRELPGHLLDAVFAQGINAGGDGLPAGGGVGQFAGAHQGDVRTGAAGFGGGGFDFQADGRNVFGYGHGKFLPFYFCWELLWDRGDDLRGAGRRDTWVPPYNRFCRARVSCRGCGALSAAG